MKGTTPYPSIDTPAALIDMDILEANINEMAQATAKAGIKLRPHVKVHQCPEIAKIQLEAGACGVEVGLIDQAAVMAEAGINDIIVAHPFYGERKFEKVKKLVTKPGLKLAIVVDMVEQAEELSKIGQEVGKKIPVHIKIDTGIKRYGVLPGTPMLELARKLSKLPGIEIAGIYAHESSAQTVPTDEGVAKVALEVGSIMCEMARLLRKEGFKIEDVSTGASPTIFAICRWVKEGVLKEITEVHPGQRAIGDIAYSYSLGCARDRCVLTVLSTVVSTSHQTYVVIDAGFKALGGESIIGRRDTPGFFWNGMPSFGAIKGRDDLWLGRVGAESGWVYYKENAKKLTLGERFEIVPNSASLILNIHDKAYGVRNGVIEREFSITGRGRGT
ncbi:MAG: alanine racemase [Chloroflexi bacterium]|nr:alanine racemase [Chloroflexota bacterium]